MRRGWAAYGAATWAFAFAAVSAYWALGGRVGQSTLSPSVTERIDQPVFLAVVWATAVLKVLAGLLALALVRPWGRRLPRRPLAIAAWGAGVLLTLYGAIGLTQAALALSGVIQVAGNSDRHTLWWYALLWEPYWLFGGVLFLAAARQHRRRTPVTPRPARGVKGQR